MLTAYEQQDDGLTPLRDGPIDRALWIDLYQPTPDETARATALGHEIPALSAMQEIEVSRRLYRARGADYMTIVLPGRSGTEAAKAGPVTFILSPERLVTVRHHAPNPFETFPARADQSATGCASAERVFLGLVDEIVARLADLLEAVGAALDTLSSRAFEGGDLRGSLREVGRQGEQLARLRLSLLTIERALSFFEQTLPGSESALHGALDAAQRDIAALGVHGEFLSSRVTLATDTTLGMIDLEQNATVRIVSVVAVLFLPPTLVASVYGMNFAAMPELDTPWGYPVALLLMLASALVTYLYFKWRRWL